MLAKNKTRIITVIIFYICLRSLSSCTSCYNCTPKGATGDAGNPLEVCQGDDEERTTFINRIDRYRRGGYVCN